VFHAPLFSDITSLAGKNPSREKTELGETPSERKPSWEKPQLGETSSEGNSSCEKPQSCYESQGSIGTTTAM